MDGSTSSTSIPTLLDVVLVADLLGHARLDSTRRYSLASAADRAAALGDLAVDR
jgi:integrase/recombinase XerC